jgi:putative DNA primase/helicase
VRPEVLGRVAEILKPGDFYRETHGAIYQAMLDLQGNGAPVDLVTVTALLKERGKLEEVGGPDMRGEVFLAALSEEVGYATNAGYYGKILYALSLKRQLKAKAALIAEACGKADFPVGDLLLFADSQIQEIASRNGNAKGLDLGPTIIEASDFRSLDMPERRSFLYPFLREFSIGMITADRGTGKTMLALGGICDAVSRGCGFGPWEGGQPANCLYIDAEMVAQDIIQRLGYFPTNNRPAQLFILSDHLATMKGFPGASLLNPEWRTGVKEFCLTHHVGLVVFDNLASLTAGIDENSAQDWGPLAKYFLELRFAGVSSLFLHHTGKAGGQRGTHAREDALDYSILLERPKDYSPEDGSRFVLNFTKARVKQADANLISPVDFRLEKDMAGAYIWTWKHVKPQNQRAVLEMLDQGLKQQEIADAVGVTRSRVAQIKAKAIKDGWLTEKGKLTQMGIIKIN